MPLYEFGCKRCGEMIEGIYPIGQGPKRHAGGCGGVMERLVSRCGIRFRQNVNDVHQSGWANSGYGRGPDHPKADFVLSEDGKTKLGFPKAKANWQTIHSIV
jgi:predicted nucleic acid-binding Zn ribbon protein